MLMTGIEGENEGRKVAKFLVEYPPHNREIKDRDDAMRSSGG